MRRHPPRPVAVTPFLAVLLLTAAHGGTAQTGNDASEAMQREALASLRRVRLEEALIRAERTAVMLGDLLAVPPREGIP